MKKWIEKCTNWEPYTHNAQVFLIEFYCDFDESSLKNTMYAICK